MTTSFSTTESDWQKLGAEVIVSQNTETRKREIKIGDETLPIDNVPEEGSDGLVNSGGVFVSLLQEEVFKSDAVKSSFSTQNQYAYSSYDVSFYTRKKYIVIIKHDKPMNSDAQVAIRQGNTHIFDVGTFKKGQTVFAREFTFNPSVSGAIGNRVGVYYLNDGTFDFSIYAKSIESHISTIESIISNTVEVEWLYNRNGKVVIDGTKILIVGNGIILNYKGSAYYFGSSNTDNIYTFDFDSQRGKILAIMTDLLANAQVETYLNPNDYFTFNSSANIGQYVNHISFAHESHDVVKFIGSASFFNDCNKSASRNEYVLNIGKLRNLDKSGNTYTEILLLPFPILLERQEKIPN